MTPGVSIGFQRENLGRNPEKAPVKMSFPGNARNIMADLGLAPIYRPWKRKKK
jgi:hypothetical protein